MKVIAVDYGTRRVGIAVGDEELRLAVPKTSIPFDRNVYEKIKGIVEESGAVRIVVGLPLTPSGKEGTRVKEVREFVRELERRIPDVEIILWDERYTTYEAESRLKGVHPSKRKAFVDAISAQVILEEYLDSL